MRIWNKNGRPTPATLEADAPTLMSKSKVKKTPLYEAIKELELAGLIHRVSQGSNRPAKYTLLSIRQKLFTVSEIRTHNEDNQGDELSTASGNAFGIRTQEDEKFSTVSGSASRSASEIRTHPIYARESLEQSTVVPVDVDVDVTREHEDLALPGGEKLSGKLGKKLNLIKGYGDIKLEGDQLEHAKVIWDFTFKRQPTAGDITVMETCFKVYTVASYQGEDEMSFADRLSNALKGSTGDHVRNRNGYIIGTFQTIYENYLPYSA